MGDRVTYELGPDCQAHRHCNWHCVRGGGVRRRRGRAVKDGSLKAGRSSVRNVDRSATDGEIFSDRSRKNAALYGGLFRDRRPHGDRDVCVARGLSSGSDAPALFWGSDPKAAIRIFLDRRLPSGGRNCEIFPLRRRGELEMRAIIQRWTPADDERLKGLAAQGASIVKAAAALKRRQSVVRERANKLGCPLPTLKASRQKWADRPNNN